MRTRHEKLGWLFLVTYFLTAAIWAPGLVLCFEPDGHVGLESASADCSGCCPAEERGAREDPVLETCACQDVAFGLSSSPVRKSDNAERGQPDLPGRASLPASLRPARTVTLAPGHAHSHASAALPLLRTVVLLV